MILNEKQQEHRRGLESKVQYNKSKLTTDNSQINQHTSRSYKAVDGRTYQTEQDTTQPLPIRKDQLKKLVESERISAVDIWRIEAFLRGEELDPRAVPSNDKRTEIVEKYRLWKENEVQKTARWVGDPVFVFEKLCEQWPDAIRFKKYKGVLYAMRYGDTPCKVYTTKNAE